MTTEKTSFQTLFQRFYDRIETDEDFFGYYQVDRTEALELAHLRAKNYLIDALDRLSSTGELEVDFNDYNEEVETVNFEMLGKESKLIAEIMFAEYMKRDVPLLHAFRLSFSPSDLTVFPPSGERTSYLDMIGKLEHDIELMIDDYKSRDRKTGKLKQAINYSAYADD